MLSMIFQDVMGGEIRYGTVRKTPHYWNRLAGVDYDLSADQFGFEVPRVGRNLYRKSVRFSRGRHTALDPAVGDNSQYNLMYEKFKKRLVRCLEMKNEEDVAIRERIV